MKQYHAVTNYHAGPIIRTRGFPYMRHEALVGSSYGRMTRHIRRRMGKSALRWWREQTSTEAMPFLYHMGGYGK